ncbi:VPLPA-CTERM sorting domain-containing protein [Tropicimonas sp.]|uniref:VPLPA-CTERM sorting domain-containing protein n=1 Tax=Tropicimonas sp. TaxID=2067044 RepID=UPI003A868C49
MLKRHLAAAATVVAASAAIASQTQAATIDVITGGSATFQITAPLAELYLGTNWRTNEETGYPTSTASVSATGLDDNNVLTGSGSQVLDDGGALLSLRTRGIYLYPINTEGEEISSFAAVKNFSFRPSEEDIAAGITDEMRNINYVPTDDPNVFTDYRDPTTSYTLTDEQVARLNDGNLRTCCRHTLNGFTINTSGAFVDGVIDNMTERDTNFDGVVDEADYFHLFTLVGTDDDSIWDLALTDTMAQYLNYGFTAFAFEDSSDFLAQWPSTGLNFAGGDVIGTLSYAYEVSSVESVPLPAALPLLAGGLGVMGFFGRRKRKAA